MSDVYDVVVIGAGPAGYPAAIRAAQNKLKAACVDEWQNTDGSYAFGGTCLNAGCIPSKALLESSELFQRAKHEFEIHGIKIGALTLDLGAMQKRRASIVKTMTNGINALFKANGVVGIQGHGRLLPGNKVLVRAPDGTEKTFEAKNVIIASGSAPIRLAAVPHDGTHIVDSWNALEFDAVPKRLGVIGAGVIGLELGSVWRRLGSEVVVLEALEQFLPMVDQTIAKEAQRHFKKQGLAIKLGAKVLSAAVSGNAVDVVYSDAQGEHSLQVDMLVVAVGRRPFTEDLLAEGAGVQLDERGFIKVDEHCRAALAKECRQRQVTTD
ncbi:MAG: FAD-dependent oxidoreductase, partial [Steroidobacteraceae bacterium]